MATNIVFPVAAADQFRHGKEIYYIAIVCAANIPFDKMPLDANLRRAKSQSKTVKGMIQTLMESPRDFLKSNLGIVLIAEDAEFKYDAAGNPCKLAVKMLPKLHGVANGGHTINAIKQAWTQSADLTEAYVVIRVNVGVLDDAVKNAVVHLNTAEKVDRASILFKYGTFDVLKMALEEQGFKTISYYQNQAEAENRTKSTRQTVVHVIKLLTAMDSIRFDAKKKQHPVSVVGGGSVVMDVKTIDRAEALIEDCLPVAVVAEKLICQKVAGNPKKLPGIKPEGTQQDSLLVDGTVIPFAIPSVFALPVVAALRAFIVDDKWQLPLDKDLDQDDNLLREVIDVLWKDYASYLNKEWEKDRRNIGGILRNEEVWINLYTSAKEFETRYLREMIRRGSESNGRIPSQIREKNKSLN